MCQEVFCIPKWYLYWTDNIRLFPSWNTLSLHARYCSHHVHSAAAAADEHRNKQQRCLLSCQHILGYRIEIKAQLQESINVACDWLELMYECVMIKRSDYKLTKQCYSSCFLQLVRIWLLQMSCDTIIMPTPVAGAALSVKGIQN